MTIVYHELLPESYLLILAPGGAGGPEAALANSLHCARRSGKPAVWVDCSLVKGLSAEATQLLWASHQQLREHDAELVLVHVPDHVRNELLDHLDEPAPCIVATLLDAAQHTRAHNSPWLA